VTRDDVKAYADAGDQNPLHQSDGFARSVGFDGVIAHGMLTMGHIAACGVARPATPRGLGDLGAVPRHRLDGEIVAGGRVRAIDAEHLHRHGRLLGDERARRRPRAIKG
jgi:acyl dehydratase